MDYKKLLNDPELIKALKDIENKPLMEGAQILLPIIQKMGLTQKDIQEMISKELSFKNPLGQEKLNPMYEAKIIERVQFDGDAPELRTGAMPKDGSPAVPVDTESQNPALIGAELKKASDEVQEDMNLIAQKSTELALIELSEPLGYERGKLPVPRKAGEFSLLDMSQEEKKGNTWRFISTTQGRNSAVPNIEKKLLEALNKRGFRASVGEDIWDMEYEWTTGIASGERATQENFDYIGSVVRIFERIIVTHFEQGDLIFKVMSVNNIPARKVGWYISIKGSKK